MGDGYALYPLDGLPILDEESFCAVFDITGKQREKILFRHERLPEHLNVEDVAAGDKLVREYETTFINGGLRLKPLKTNNGVMFIRSLYLSPLEDVIDMVQFYERTTPQGGSHIVAKAGFLTAAVIMPYADVPAWKKAQNMNSKAEILCWPMFGLGDRAFHASVHAAGLMGKTDSDNGGCPAESPSNKSLQIDRAMLADGTTVLLDLAQANYLNSNGIVTALNFIGSYVLWGDETACFPADTDVKNYFISVSRMFGWVARSVILTYWSKIDKKMTRRLIDSIVDSVNIWLNGLVSEEKLLGARVEFLDEENSTTALMAGKAVFHIYMTPASPMRECEFVLEYDADYVTAALSA